MGMLCGIGVYAGFRYQHTSAERPENAYGPAVRQIQSSVDKDQDGIDDQTDILQEALKYVSTKPKYKSRYYETGYPDDKYGVCTDVTANALKHAGYDVMELIQKDIEEHPDDYDIEEPDIYIDFRRVKNLKVYFANTAVSLTLDLSEIEQWQGGDIVILRIILVLYLTEGMKEGCLMSYTTMIRGRSPMNRIFWRAGMI